MTGQHEPLWKPEVKPGAPEGQAFHAPHAAPVIMYPMSTYVFLNLVLPLLINYLLKLLLHDCLMYCFQSKMLV